MLAYNNLVKQKEVDMDFNEYCNTKIEDDACKKNNFGGNNQGWKGSQTNKTKTTETANESSASLNEEEIKKTIEKYQNYSSEQLLGELLRQTSKQKAEGKYDGKKMEDFSKQIRPMLSVEQQNKLDEILKLLR